MNLVKKLLCMIIPTVLLGLIAMPAFSGEIVLSGSIACPAANFTRKGGNEIHDRSYGLRNYNSDSTVTIIRVQAWDNDGTNTFDGLPVVSGFKTTLKPQESGKFNASHVLPTVVPPHNIQQIRIDYVLDQPGMPLHVAYAHFVRRADLGNYQTSRHGGVCMHIPPGARH